MRRQSQEEPLDDTHGWREVRQLHPKDIALRHAGYRIHSRPKVGPILWERDGKVLPQDEAERRARITSTTVLIADADYNCQERS